MKTVANLVCAMLVSSLPGLPAHAAPIPLYPTGPAEDSAFIRFVNGNPSEALQIRAAGSQAQIVLDSQSRASAYMPVAGSAKIAGELQQGQATQNVMVSMQPSEFVTVLTITDDHGIQLHEIREKADDFTAIRASIAFYDLNEQCTDAAVQVAGRSAFLFENVEVNQWVRRQINAVPLSVQLICAGEPVGEPLDLGVLQAGERYSLFLIPGELEQAFFSVKDSVLN